MIPVSNTPDVRSPTSDRGYCLEAKPDLKEESVSLSDDQQTYRWMLEYLYFLHADWQIYWELFGKRPGTVAVLNRRSGKFFWHIQQALSDRVILGITKLFDDNARLLKRLICNFRPRVDLTEQEQANLKEHRKTLCQNCEELCQRYRSLRRHRDKRIAHNDRAIIKENKTVDDVPFLQIRSAITDLWDLFGGISILRYGEQVGFAGAEIDLSNACSNLMKILEYGNIAMDHREAEIVQLREQIRDGKLPENFDSKMLHL